MSRTRATTPSLPTTEQWQGWGVDPRWSRVVEVHSTVGGHTIRWHVLDRPAEPDGTAAGSAPPPTVVCVHGNPTWGVLWQPLLTGLPARYRVIAVDQLGMGFSQRTEPRRFATRVDDLGDLIDALHLDGPIVIVGHDWGGAVSMGWAVSPRAAGRLAGMVLCNTGIAVPPGRRAPRLIALAARRPLTSLVCRHTRGFVDGAIALSGRRLERWARDALRAPYRRAAHRHAIADFVEDVPLRRGHPSEGALAEVAERLAEVRVPVLLAWGAADPVFDDDFAHHLASLMPHAHRHRFAASGHLSPLEHTADLCGVLSNWLTAHAEHSDAAATHAEAVATPAPAPQHDASAWSALEARRDDSTLAYLDGATGARLSFAELHRRVMGIAAGLAERGVAPGDRVALLVPPGPDLLAAAYGCWRAGAVTVVADRGLGLGGLRRAVRSAHVQWVIGPPQALAAARVLRWAPRARRIAVSGRATGAECTLDQLAASVAALPAEPASDHPAAVLFTSGATGPAKGVRYRHGQLVAQSRAIAECYGITHDDRLVAAFAPFALYGPALGITSCIPDVDVTRPGSLTATVLGEACAAIDATIVFASPAALANVVRTATTDDRRLSAVRLVLSAGAPVPIDTLRAVAQLAPAAALHTPYGMTECLPVADIDLGQLQHLAGTQAGVCVGPPVAGVQVAVAPIGFDAGIPATPVPSGTTGEIVVRAPWCSDGYDALWRTEQQARPRLADGMVWHRTGDVGHLDTVGRLWVEGRSAHLVHTADGPVTPVPVEVAVERLPTVERCAAVGVGPVGCQQVVLVVEQHGCTAGLAPPALAAEVRASAPTSLAAVLQVPALPVDIRHNTKIDRTALGRWAEAVLRGERARPPR